MKFGANMPWVLALGCSLMSSAVAQELTVENDQFVYDGQLIPAGCIVQLSPQLNGDQLIASVFLQRPSYRGCMAANFPYPQQEAGAKPPTYEIVHKLTDSVYWINACAYSAEGTHRKSCSKLQITFEHRDYHSKKGPKRVLSVSATGEWSDLIWANANKHFDTAQRVQVIRKHYQAVAGNQRLKTSDYQRQCASAPTNSLALTHRYKNGKVVEVTERFVEEPSSGNSSYVFKSEKLIFAFIENVDPASHTQDRIYFLDQKAFLCKKSHIGRAPAGFEAGVAKEVPCAVGDVEQAVEKAQRLLTLHRSQDVQRYGVLVPVNTPFIGVPP